NQIPAMDKSLAEKYSEKNISIKRRKKHIFYNLVIIPLCILIIPLLIQFALYNIFEGFDAEAFRIGAGITILALLIFSVISLVKFFKLRQNFKNVMGEIGDLLHRKRNVF